MGFVYTVQGSLPGTPPPPSLPRSLCSHSYPFFIVSLECLATLAEGELMGEGLSQGALPPPQTPCTIPHAGSQKPGVFDFPFRGPCLCVLLPHLRS